MDALEVFELWEFEYIVSSSAPEFLQMTHPFLLTQCGITLGQPSSPRGFFVLVVVGPAAPKMFRRAERRLVDEVPNHVVDARVTPRKRRNEVLLRSDGAPIEIGIETAPRLRKKGEEREDDRNVIPVRGQQKRIERSQYSFVNLAVRRHVFLPTGPNARADHVDARLLHRLEILVPNGGIRFEKKSAMNVGGHVGRARDGKHFAVAIEEIIVDGQWLAARHQRFVVEPEA